MKLHPPGDAAPQHAQAPREARPKGRRPRSRPTRSSTPFGCAAVPAARLRRGMDVAGELGALSAALENDLAVVKVRELGAMADADNARMLELAPHLRTPESLRAGRAGTGPRDTPAAASRSRPRDALPASAEATPSTRARFRADGQRAPHERPVSAPLTSVCSDEPNARYAFGGRIATASISSRKAGLARRGT